jgi:RecJ-like exonuclease
MNMSNNTVRCNCCQGMGTIKVSGLVEHCCECKGTGKVDPSRSIGHSGVNWSTNIGQGTTDRGSMYSVTSGCYQKTPLYFN